MHPTHWLCWLTYKTSITIASSLTYISCHTCHTPAQFALIDSPQTTITMFVWCHLCVDAICHTEFDWTREFASIKFVIHAPPSIMLIIFPPYGDSPTTIHRGDWSAINHRNYYYYYYYCDSQLDRIKVNPTRACR